MDLKSMHVNASKSVTRMKKRAVDILTRLVGSAQMRYVRDVTAVDRRQAIKQGGKGYFDFVVASKTYP